MEATKALQNSAGWERWIRVRRQNGLSRYSANNQFLLVCEAWSREIEVSYIAGYRWWADHGYQVRRGEKALHILGPVSRKLQDETTGEKKLRVVGFRDVAVFDRSQVDGTEDAMPIEPPVQEPLTGDSHAEVIPKLEHLAGELGSSVSYSEELRDGVGGHFNRKSKLIAIRPGEPNAMVRTLLHEIAHAICHSKRDHKTREVDGWPLDYASEECIVECAAHVAAASVGLDTAGESVSYVAGWGEDGNLATVTLAAELVDAIAKHLEDACGDLGPETENKSREAVAA